MIWLVVHEDDGDLVFSTGVKSVRKRHLRSAFVAPVKRLVFESEAVLERFLAEKCSGVAKQLQDFTVLMRRFKFQSLAVTANELADLCLMFGLISQRPATSARNWLTSLDFPPNGLLISAHSVFEPCLYVPNILETMSADRDWLRFEVQRSVAAASWQVELLDREFFMESDPLMIPANWERTSVTAAGLDSKEDYVVLQPGMAAPVELRMVTGGPHRLRPHMDLRFVGEQLPTFVVDFGERERMIPARCKWASLESMALKRRPVRAASQIPMDLFSAVS